jgi:hypothetical protein
MELLLKLHIRISPITCICQKSNCLSSIAGKEDTLRDYISLAVADPGGGIGDRNVCQSKV